MSRHRDEHDDEPLGRPFLPAAPGLPGGPGAGWIGGSGGGADSEAGAGSAWSGSAWSRLDPLRDGFDPGYPGYPGYPGDPGDPHGPPDAPSGGGEVRPYLLTGGRTQARGAAVAMETVVIATGAAPTRRPGAAGLERSRILQLCERPCSAAEVAARLALPLPVALVLVTDLVAERLLAASRVAPRQSDDVDLLERLIAGVAAL